MSSAWGVSGGFQKKKEKVEDPSFVESETGAGRRKRIQDSNKQDSKTLLVDYSSSDTPPNSSPFQNRKQVSNNASAPNIEEDIVGETENDFLVHKIQSKDTLQGLLIRYRVSEVDLKKVNKLFRANDIFARKTLIIPITMQQYLSIKQSESKSTHSQLDDTRKKELVGKFIGLTKCTEDTAYTYLSEKDWNFTKALGYYQQQQQPQAKTADFVDFGESSPPSSGSQSRSNNNRRNGSFGGATTTATTTTTSLEYDASRWKVDYTWEQQEESYRRARAEYEHEKSLPSADYLENKSELIHAPSTPNMQRLRRDEDEFFDL